MWALDEKAPHLTCDAHIVPRLSVFVKVQFTPSRFRFAHRSIVMTPIRLPSRRRHHISARLKCDATALPCAGYTMCHHSLSGARILRCCIGLVIVCHPQAHQLCQQRLGLLAAPLALAE